MKKLMVCLFALTAMVLVSCGKDEDKTPDYAAAFIGNYTASVDAVLNVPLLGEVPLPINNLNVTVTRGLAENEVKMTTMNQTLDGYCNASGLHLDPFVSNTSVRSMDISVTVTMPTVPAPVNNTVTGDATLAATVMGYSVTGSATYTAVKQ